MPTPGSSDQAYAACVHMAVELAAPVARHIHAKAGESMLRRAAATPDPEERRLQIEAARMLGEQRDAFRAAFAPLLQRELERLEREEASKGDALSFGALELMGEEQIDETVEAVRAQQTVLSYVESDLGSLNALVSAARGRDTASAAANPLRPQAWVAALRAACDQCHAPAWARARWVTHLSEMLGPELASVYRQLTDTLTRDGVSAASFAVHTPKPGSRPAGAPAPAQPRGGERAAGPAPVLNLRDLRRLLAGDGGAPAAARAQQPPSAAAPVSDTIAPTMPWALEAVQQMTRMDEIIERVEQRLSGSGQLSAREGPLTPVQLLGQEVVRVMVDKMARDERLLPPVRDALRQLEPALLRLAANDPRFFRDQQHPTRRFLSEMTERSLAWDTPQAAGFAQFFEPLRQAVAVLSDLRMENAEPFDYALQSLTETWDQQEARSRRERANAARALIKAERRNLLARRISERLRQREEVLAAVPQLRRFIIGPWAQVMAAAQMADASGSDDPGGYAAVVDELLASTQSGVDPQRRARLAKTVPGLVAAVRGGLASIEYPDDQTRQFLQALAELHRSALTVTDTPVPSRPAPAFAGSQDDEGDPSDLWLEPTEARASSLMEIAPATGPRREPEPDTALDELRPAARAHLPLAADRLQEGTWVDLYLDGAWARWRLSWASPQLLLFMFADGSGHYKSMTRSVLETLNRVGALRFVSAERIVDGALDAVAQTALRNSTQSSY